jgi:hypothetical protein
VYTPSGDKLGLMMKEEERSEDSSPLQSERLNTS